MLNAGLIVQLFQVIFIYFQIKLSFVPDMIKDDPITKENPFRICFVCLGNICRSPTAEGIFQHLVKERGLKSYFFIDSAGTSAFHLGERANSRSRQVAKENGMELNSRARRFESGDLEEFDLILAMDSENYRNIQQLISQNKHSEKVMMMRNFDLESGPGDVPDPYYGGVDGFQNVFDVVYRSCEALLDQLEERIKN